MKKLDFKGYRPKQEEPESPQKKKREINHGYEALGKEIAAYLKCKTSQFWFLFYQVEEWKIRQAFNEIKKQGLGVKDLIKFSKSIK